MAQKLHLRSHPEAILSVATTPPPSQRRSTRGPEAGAIPGGRSSSAEPRPAGPTAEPRAAGAIAEPRAAGAIAEPRAAGADRPEPASGAATVPCPGTCPPTAPGL